MRKFEYKYRVDEAKRTIVALSSFAGKTVVGIARCAPSDVFDVETGKKLAAARCSLKIAEKRMKRAEVCRTLALEHLGWWQRRADRMNQYTSDSVAAYQSAVAALAELEKNI